MLFPIDNQAAADRRNIAQFDLNFKKREFSEQKCSTRCYEADLVRNI